MCSAPMTSRHTGRRGPQRPDAENVACVNLWGSLPGKWRGRLASLFARETTQRAVVRGGQLLHRAKPGDATPADMRARCWPKIMSPA